MAFRDIRIEVLFEAREYAAENTLYPHWNAGAEIVTLGGKCLTWPDKKLARAVTNESGRWDRPQRYLYVEIVPRAANVEITRRGDCVDGNWIVTAILPVADDARASIETGRRGVAAPAPDLSNRLDSDYYVAAQRIFFESAMQIECLTPTSVS